MGNNIEDERFDEVLRGPTNLTGAINTAEYFTQFSLQPGNEWPDRGYDTENVWEELNGANIQSLKPDATLAELTTDGGQTDSRVAVESPSLVYRPGSELSASAGVFVDVLPTGDSTYTIKYGREDDTYIDPFTGGSFGVGQEFAELRIVDGTGDRDHDLQFAVGTDVDGDGDAEVNVVDITAGDWEADEFITEFENDPKARVYGKDPLNGCGPSSITYDATTGYTYGIEVGWYAPTSLVPYLIETVDRAGVYKQRRHPILIYNPLDGPAIRRPNQPVTVTVDNGTSGQNLQARLGGRAGAYSGEAIVNPTPNDHTVTGQDVPTTGGTVGTEGLNWHVVAVAKATATDPDSVIAPRPPTLSSNNRAVFMVRVAEESDISGTIEYDEPSNTVRGDTEVAIDAVEDTPDRLSLNTIVDPADGETKFAGVKVGSSLISSAGANQAGLTYPEEDFGLTLPRDFVFVYLAATRGNNDATLDAEYTFNNSG